MVAALAGILAAAVMAVVMAAAGVVAAALAAITVAAEAVAITAAEAAAVIAAAVAAVIMAAAAVVIVVPTSSSSRTSSRSSASPTKSSCIASGIAATTPRPMWRGRPGGAESGAERRVSRSRRLSRGELSQPRSSPDDVGRVAGAARYCADYALSDVAAGFWRRADHAERPRSS